MKKPKRLTDLVDSPYNPRFIDDEALGRLKTSIDTFGDISGITWNSRTGNIICGHQRFRALKEKYGDELVIADGCIVTPSGSKFAIRVVDWNDSQEKAANLAANHSGLQGDWTEGLAEVLEEVLKDLPDMYASLDFSALETFYPEMGPELDEGLADGVELCVCKKCGNEHSFKASG